MTFVNNAIALVVAACPSRVLLSFGFIPRLPQRGVGFIFQGEGNFPAGKPTK